MNILPSARRCWACLLYTSYNAALSPDTVSYVGIAEDEPKRLARLDGVKKVSLLAKYGMTEVDAYKLCRCV